MSPYAGDQYHEDTPTPSELQAENEQLPPEPRRFQLWVCPDCGGYMAEHLGKAIGNEIKGTVWHNHDGRHVDFELVDVVEIVPPPSVEEQLERLATIRDAARRVLGDSVLAEEEDPPSAPEQPNNPE